MSSTASTRTSLRSKRVWCSCALSAAAMMLTACSSVRPTPLSYGHASQPGYLYLSKGSQVPTMAGLYVPTQDETWVSEAKLAAKDQQILELTRALQEVQLRLSLSPRSNDSR